MILSGLILLACFILMELHYRRSVKRLIENRKWDFEPSPKCPHGQTDCYSCDHKEEVP